MLLSRAGPPRHLNSNLSNPAYIYVIIASGAGINTLKQQGHCEGTYTILAGKESNGSPVYKHNT